MHTKSEIQLMVYWRIFETMQALYTQYNNKSQDTLMYLQLDQ